MIVPFEQLIYQADDGEVATGKTRITEHGTRLLIFGIDFIERAIEPLFDGVLVDFLGVIDDSGTECPNQLVRANINGKIAFTRLIYKDGKYTLSAKEVTASKKSK